MDDIRAKRLWVFVYYEGPWERLGLWLLAIDRETAEIRREVKPGTIRDRLADFCDRRDAAWKTRWAARYPKRRPPRRWRRSPERSGGDREDMSTKQRTCAPAPCLSCPYRRDVPSGIWDETEYDKLPGYDGTTGDQAEAGAFAVFFCHQRTGKVCAGWVGCHDMDENLAIRMSRESLDVQAILAYESPVPLFVSGAQAAAHGKRDIEEPCAAARAAIGKLLRRRGHKREKAKRS